MGSPGIAAEIRAFEGAYDDNKARLHGKKIGNLKGKVKGFTFKVCRN